MTFKAFLPINTISNNAAFEHLRMRRLLGAALISMFLSQLRRLLESGVYKRATFKRGNTVYTHLVDFLELFLGLLVVTAHSLSLMCGMV